MTSASVMPFRAVKPWRKVFRTNSLAAKSYCVYRL